MTPKYKLHFHEDFDDEEHSHWEESGETPEEVQACIERCRSKIEGTKLVITVYKLEKTVTLTPSPATVTVVE